MRTLLLAALLASPALPARAQSADPLADAGRRLGQLIKGRAASGAPSVAVSSPTPVTTPALVEAGLWAKLEKKLFYEGEDSLLVTGKSRRETKCLESKRSPGAPGTELTACLEAKMVLPTCTPEPGKGYCGAPAVLRYDLGSVVLQDERWVLKASTPTAGAPAQEPVYQVYRWTYVLAQDDRLMSASMTFHEAKESDQGPFLAMVLAADPSQAGVQALFKDAAKRALRLVHLVSI